MKNGKFIGIKEIEITSIEKLKIKSILEYELKQNNVSVHAILESVNQFTFYIGGYDYVNKTKGKMTVKPLTTIYVNFTKKIGFSCPERYEASKIKASHSNYGREELEKLCDSIGYSFEFITNSQTRRYRARQWEELRGDNFYIYNDSLDCEVLRQEIQQEIASIFFYKLYSV